MKTEREIRELVSRMTLEEKAAFVSGRDFWHTEDLPRLEIPSVMVSDGPHGLRKQSDEADHLGVNDSIEAVCFPAACATACTFDREMMREMGTVLGKECQAENVSTLLGPAVCIKRSPLCGRNFEYVSEDPFVAGELSAAYIQGVQSQNVGTSIKHFAANNQEHERMNSSSDADERTLREIYLPAFETAVKKAQPWTVMCSYNRINGTYASQDPWLLTEVLRDDWGFEGLVMSDWGAVSDRVEGLWAGMDLEMPGSNGTNDAEIIRAVQDGSLPEDVLDESVARILTWIFKYADNRQQEKMDLAADHDASEKFAERCVVLLKNDEQALPLKKEENIALIGGFASAPRYQGGGSSHINTKRVVSAVSVADRFGKVTFAEGFSKDLDVYEEDKAAEALAAAKAADKIVVFAGLPDLFESEGYDREHMRLPDCQNRLVGELIETGKPVIVVLHNGSPVEMPWVSEVKGIVEGYLLGEGSGEALMKVLYGEVNPGGKLAESFPLRLQDNPSYLTFGGKNKHVPYQEGIFVGYRYYDSKEMPVLFPFGYGLSYTSFSYSNLRLEKMPVPEEKILLDFLEGEEAEAVILAEEETVSEEAARVSVPADGTGTITPDDLLLVSVDITNTGDREGREVVQLYVSDKTGAAIRPVHELKGFESVSLKPGETKTVTMELNFRSFAWFDMEEEDWCARNGKYELQVGKSSRDIVMTAEVEMTESQEFLPEAEMNVMMGDLLDCPKTQGFVKEYLEKFSDGFLGESASDDFEEMAKKMMDYMPLRSFRSFVGLTNDELRKLVYTLRKYVE